MLNKKEKDILNSILNEQVRIGIKYGKKGSVLIISDHLFKEWSDELIKLVQFANIKIYTTKEEFIVNLHPNIDKVNLNDGYDENEKQNHLTKETANTFLLNDFKNTCNKFITNEKSNDLGLDDFDYKTYKNNK